MFVSADQLIAHALGDYLLQSDWMALKKTKTFLVAIVHALFYLIPFFFLTSSVPALLFISSSHAVIDHFRLARYVVWVKNFLAPKRSVGDLDPITHRPSQPSTLWWRSWSECKDTGGYPPERPVWMTTWLLIIADNVIHVLLNAAALKWL